MLPPLSRTQSDLSPSVFDSYMYHINDSVVSPALSPTNTYELEFNFETINDVTNHKQFSLQSLAVVCALSLSLTKWHTGVFNYGEMIGYRMWNDPLLKPTVVKSDIYRWRDARLFQQLKVRDLLTSLPSKSHRMPAAVPLITAPLLIQRAVVYVLRFHQAATLQDTRMQVTCQATRLGWLDEFGGDGGGGKTCNLAMQ
jgi:hypothetical protein